MMPVEFFSHTRVKIVMSRKWRSSGPTYSAIPHTGPMNQSMTIETTQRRNSNAVLQGSRAARRMAKTRKLRRGEGCGSSGRTCSGRLERCKNAGYASKGQLAREGFDAAICDPEDCHEIEP